MDISTECILCAVRKIDHLYDELIGKKTGKLDFMKEIYRIAAETKAQDTAPLLSARMLRLFLCEAGIEDPYREQKEKYNRILLKKEPSIEEGIRNAVDPLAVALKYAMVGNLIDFGAMDDISDSDLDVLLERAPKLELDEAMVEEFFKQLMTAEKLVYIGDNAGEIVLDKIFVKILREYYPNLDIVFLVRGKPVFNDATLEDAEQVGLSRLLSVLGNGTDIPGTQLNHISLEALQEINRADLILAKGQGNFETLSGCGHNVFYLFLCKCALFTKRFKMKQFEGVFTHEAKLEI
jgi:hypothetical protein